MKKVLLIVILIMQSALTFSQTSYGNWITDSCYDYIQFQMKYNGESSFQAGTARIKQGWYSIRIRNTSSKKVQMGYTVSMNSQREVFKYSSSKNMILTEKVDGHGAPDAELSPNEIIETGVYLTNYFQNIIYFQVWSIRVLSNNGINRYYESCSDGRTCVECTEYPNQSPCGSKSITDTNTTNNQNTAAERQQQAQNEYNERIRQDQERQNREIADKRQQYSSAFNAGTSAYNSGNYTEAKTQFANAINLANSEQERTPAQNNYNKSNDAIDREIKAKALNDAGNILLTGLDAIMQANYADKIRKQEELEVYRKNEKLEENRKLLEENKVQQQTINALNGECLSQVEKGRSSFKDGNYGLAKHYYEMVLSSNNNDCYTRIISEYATILSILGNKEVLLSLIKRLESEKKAHYLGKYSYPMLKIFSSEYFDNNSFSNQTVIKSGMDAIIIGSNDYADRFDIINEFKSFYSYMQVVGGFEEFGIIKNEEQGFNFLNKIDEVTKYNTYVSRATRYYLGMIYLTGTTSVKKDEKKALKYFIKAYGKTENELITAPIYKTFPADMYFNYELLAYLKIGELYSLKNNMSNHLLGQKMLDIFFRDFRYLIPKSDLSFFPTVTNESEPTNKIYPWQVPNKTESIFKVK